MTEPANDTAQSSSDDVCKDKDIRAKREKTFSKIMWGPKLNSAAQLMGMFGGPMLGAGLLALIGLGGATGAISTTAVVITAIGAVLQVASIVTSYIGNKSQNDGWQDQSEVGALVNARYLVKELKANNMCMTAEHKQNCRADGKSWTQATEQAAHLRG